MTRIAVVVAASLGLSGCVLLPIVLPLPQPRSSPGAQVQDVQDFSFTSFDADYSLARAENGTSILVTTEHIVAEFPEYDQNRGIHRQLLTEFDGHPTGLEVLYVTDGDGIFLAYDSATKPGVLDLTIAVPEGQYVHGEQTYVIAYAQYSVIREVDDHQALVWDVNGTGWRQPFGTVSAEVEIEQDLAPALLGDATCTFGPEGSPAPCAIAHPDRTFSLSVDDLAPGEGVTFVLPFRSGTFSG